MKKYTLALIAFLFIIVILTGNVQGETELRQLELKEGHPLRLSYENNKIFYQGEEVFLKREDEKYELPAEVKQKWRENSYSTFIFPLAVINTEKTKEVYNLEEQKIIFNEQEAISALKEEWQQITEGKPPIIMEEEIKPENFQDHLSVKLAPEGERIFFTLQHYMIATMDTAAGIYDLKSEEFTFVNYIFSGGVSNISWSDFDNDFDKNIKNASEYLAIELYDARGIGDLYIIKADSLEIIAAFSGHEFTY